METFPCALRVAGGLERSSDYRHPFIPTPHVHVMWSRVMHTCFEHMWYFELHDKRRICLVGLSCKFLKNESYLLKYEWFMSATISMVCMWFMSGFGANLAKNYGCLK